MTAAAIPPATEQARRLPTWVWVAAVWLIWGTIALGFLLTSPDHWSHGQRWSCFGISTAVECLLFAIAARRRDFPPRLRQALGINAAAFALTSSTYLYGAVPPRVGLPAISDTTDAIITVLTYAVALVGLLRWPMTRLSRARWWHFGLDAAVGVGGVVLFFTVLVTLPGTQLERSEETRRWVLTYGTAMVFDLIALNVLMVRGLALPSRRAFWVFMSALVLEIITLVVTEYLTYAYPELSTGGGADAIYVLVQLLYICSGIFLCGDPVREPSPAPLPAWLRSFNPLPLLAIVGVASLIVHESATGDVRRTAVVAIGLVAMVLMVVFRLMATTLENLRLLRAEAAEERLRQAEKMSAVSRLAGGIAHEFNNLMTTVMGHAELGAEDLPKDSAAREDFARILEAGTRAAGLTNQLLAFSGQQVTQPAPLDLAALVRQRAEVLESRAPAGVTVETVLELAPAMVMGDARQLSLVLDQLAANAFAAMPSGGRLVLRVRARVLSSALETPYISVAPAEYVLLVVEDTGVGIEPQELPRIFDPFFSTRPMHAAAGLGLAAVYGIVAAHDGGIAVDSTPGTGTTVSIYLKRL